MTLITALITLKKQLNNFNSNSNKTTLLQRKDLTLNKQFNSNKKNLK